MCICTSPPPPIPCWPQISLNVNHYYNTIFSFVYFSLAGNKIYWRRYPASETSWLPRDNLSRDAWLLAQGSKGTIQIWANPQFAVGIWTESDTICQTRGSAERKHADSPGVEFICKGNMSFDRQVNRVWITDKIKLFHCGWWEHKWW